MISTIIKHVLHAEHWLPSAPYAMHVLPRMRHRAVNTYFLNFVFVICGCLKKRNLFKFVVYMDMHILNENIKKMPVNYTTTNTNENYCKYSIFILCGLCYIHFYKQCPFYILVVISYVAYILVVQPFL